MSPKNCSLAYDVEEFTNTQQFGTDTGIDERSEYTGRSSIEFNAFNDVVEFGGTLTISF